MNGLVILGGGPAGLATAYYAERAHVPWILFEKSATVGGLCRTLRAGEHRYDTGAHRFHDRDPDVTADVRRLLGDELQPVAAPSQIYDRGRFLDFPPTPLNLLRSSGFREASRIGLEVLRARRRGGPVTSFADFAALQFGPTLARRLLLGHAEKVWGLAAERLSPDIATRRLSGMTLGSLFLEILRPGRKTSHLDGEFLYPRGGYGEIAERLRAALPSERVRTGAEVVRLECRGARVACVHFADHPPVDTPGRVASTLPLTSLVALLGDELPPEARDAAARVRFRHVRLVFLRLARERVTRNASIYFPDPSLAVSRVYEPKNRSSAMAPPMETALVAEVPCFAYDPIGKLDPAELAERVIAELAATALVEPREVLDWRHHWLPNAYPVYALDYSTQVRTLLEAVGRLSNLDTLGRGGRFFYSHLHDQLRGAKEYVRSLSAVRPLIDKLTESEIAS